MRVCVKNMQNEATQAMTDQQLELKLAPLPVWANEECRRAARTALCMVAYAPLSLGAEPAYCTSSCTATLDVCQSLWELGGALEFLQLIYYQACGSPFAPCLASDYTQADRKSTRLNSSHSCTSPMPSSACLI